MRLKGKFLIHFYFFYIVLALTPIDLDSYCPQVFSSVRDVGIEIWSLFNVDLFSISIFVVLKLLFFSSLVRDVRNRFSAGTSAGGKQTRMGIVLNLSCDVAKKMVYKTRRSVSRVEKKKTCKQLSRYPRLLSEDIPRFHRTHQRFQTSSPKPSTMAGQEHVAEGQQPSPSLRLCLRGVRRLQKRTMSAVDINELKERDEVVSNSKAKDRASLLKCRLDNIKTPDNFTRMSPYKKRNFRDPRSDKSFPRALCPELYDDEKDLPVHCGANFAPRTCREDDVNEDSPMEIATAAEIDNTAMVLSIIEEFIDVATMARADDE